MPEDTRRPALIIQTGHDDLRKKPASGGPPKTFGDIQAARERILRQIEDMRDRIHSSGGRSASRVCLARLKYADQAIAKSHRATKVFTVDTCPVVSDQSGSGDLLILVSPPALERLERRVATLSDSDAAHLTGIERLELIGLERRFSQGAQAEVQAALRREGRATLNVRILNVGLFSAFDRADVEGHLLNLFGTATEPYVSLGNFALYALNVSTMDQAMTIASMQTIQTMELMPRYYSVGVGSVDVASLSVAADAPLQDLPIVAVVDSGVAKGTPLEQLVWKRDQRVLPADMDETHGTAVAALIASGGRVTGSSFTPVARLLDAAIMPATGSITQVELVDRLEELLDQHATEVKDWNLSLGRTPGEQPSEFSDLGQILDLFHKKHGVQFFIAAGNVDPANRRMTWPLPAGRVLRDFVSAPGDAVCGVTVGSTVPRGTPAGAPVPALAPAPYSARGPIAAGVRKPDLTVPEGNLMSNGDQIGTPTMQANGTISADRAGTSFATPVVTSAGAELRSCLALGSLPAVYQTLVAKAILLHHASLPAIFTGTGFHPLDYYGYGQLGAMRDMLEDPEWRSTSLIVAALYPNAGELVIDDFPYPDGLRTAEGFRGRLLMTVVSDPVLDSSFKVEYVRSNVDVALRVLQRDGGGRLRPVAPADYLRPMRDFESRLIKEQHKWSPVKQFRSPSEVKCRGERWQLTAKLLLRDVESARVRDDPTQAEQFGVPVVIAVTIEDPTRKINVNNEMVIKWRERGYVTEEIQIQPRIRSRIQ